MFWKRINPVELVGVVLGLVAFVFVPVFQRARDNKKSVGSRSCQSRLKQMGLAFAQYTTDYDSVLPPVALGGSAFGWADALLPYLKDPRLFQCPAETQREQSGPAKSGYTDYWFNLQLSNLSLSSIGGSDADKANLFLAGDGNDESELTDARYSISSFSAKWKTDVKSPMFRHLQTANYVYLDGHVKGSQPKYLRATFAPQKR